MATYKMSVDAQGHFTPESIDAKHGDMIEFVTDSDKTKVFSMLNNQHTHAFAEQNGAAPVWAGKYTLIAAPSSVLVLSVSGSGVPNQHADAHGKERAPVNGKINVGDDG